MLNAIIARYLVGAVIAVLTAKGVIDQSAVETVTAGLAALAAGVMEYIAAQKRR